MRIAVYYDNEKTLKLMCSLLFKELEKHRDSFTLDSYTDRKALLSSCRETPYDALYLNISSSEYSSFEIAREIRLFSEESVIVFTTEDEDLIFNCFDYSPFYFIAKKDAQSINKGIERSVSNLTDYILDKKKFVIFNKNNSVTIKCKDLLYVKSDRHYLEYHMSDGKIYRQREKLNNIENELETVRFLRIHQRYLVNFSYIRSFDKQKERIILKNNELLAVSRTRKKETEKVLSDLL